MSTHTYTPASADPRKSIQMCFAGTTESGKGVLNVSFVQSQILYYRIMSISLAVIGFRVQRVMIMKTNACLIMDKDLLLYLPLDYLVPRQAPGFNAMTHKSKHFSWQ